MEIKRYSDESDAYYEARKLWNEFKEIALFEARYYLKHKVLEIQLQLKKAKFFIAQE